MSKKKSKLPGQSGRQTFVLCLRKYLTPAFYKQAHGAGRKRRRCRWELQPLLMVLLCMTWCQGDTQPERFETARAFCVALAPKRRRPGKTIQGYQKALAALPVFVLRAIAGLIRKQLLIRLGRFLKTDGWLVFGCDGSRLRCPRVAELEQRLGQAGGDSGPHTSPPQVWLTALVHLRTGLLWSWRCGKGTASERDHLGRLLPTLPAGALVVTDAGYQGYELACQIVDAGLAFLVRVSSQTMFYTPDALAVPLTQWRDGLVYYWPTDAQKEGLLPLPVRLLCVRSPRYKADVWLATSVLEEQRLPLATAAQFYRMRWENEGFFRTYKRTLGKVKLLSRTVGLIHREVEGSLLAVQLLLAQGAEAVLLLGRKGAVSSPRQTLRLIRQEIEHVIRGRHKRGYQKRLATAQRERRERSSSKVKRPWPGRADHKPPKPPKIRELNDEQKVLFHKLLEAA